MTTTSVEARTGFVSVGDAELWFEQRGAGPDVLLLAGLSDPVEAWTFQLEALADRYRVTAFDNRGAGRSPMPPDGFTVRGMADDAAGVLHALGIERAHVMGFSGGSATAQELILRHPDVVNSLVLISTWARRDVFLRTAMEAWTWLADAAPSERKMLEAFFLWIYTPRAHEDGDRRADHRRGDGVPAPAVTRGVPPPARSVEGPRLVRPAAADQRSHARRRR